MNPDPEKLRTLLDDVLPSSGENCGPTSSDVLAMLRGERTRRRRVQNGVSLLAVVAVAAGILHWNHSPVPVDAVVVQSPPKPARIVINRVNDEELFALLKGTPVALMERPYGGRTLLVIEQPVSQ